VFACKNSSRKEEKNVKEIKHSCVICGIRRTIRTVNSEQ